MALKKKNVINREDERIQEDATLEETNKTDRKENELIDQNTGKRFPEAPKERQGDGVATGEVPAGFYK